MPTMKTVKCRVPGCDFESPVLVDHLRTEHSMSVSQYVDSYPGAPWATDEAKKQHFQKAPKREGSKRYKDTISIAGVRLKKSPASVLRGSKRPSMYEYPPNQARIAALMLKRCQAGQPRNIYVWGAAGTGKTAMGRAIAADLNYEFSLYNLRDNLDIEITLGTIEVVEGTTVPKLGTLAEDLQGRLDPVTGKRRPVFIVMDDADRAPAAIAEVLRSILDSEARQAFIPECNTWVDVHPETVIWATANSSGRGDDTGLFSSVEVQDTSLLDRYHRVVKMEYMSEEFERKILTHKFPNIEAKMPGILSSLIGLSNDIRQAIDDKSILINFGHRPMVNFLEALEDLFDFTKDSGSSQNLDELAREAASQTILDWYSGETREILKRLVESNF